MILETCLVWSDLQYGIGKAPYSLRLSEFVFVVKSIIVVQKAVTLPPEKKGSSPILSSLVWFLAKFLLTCIVDTVDATPPVVDL